MTIGEFLTQYAGAFFGFLGAALAAATIRGRLFLES